MTATLIYIGQEIYQDTALVGYLERTLHEHYIFINECYRTEDSSDAVFDLLKRVLNTAEMIFIAASKESFSTAHDILDTLAPHPANTKQIAKNSYLIQNSNMTCHLFLMQNGEALPKLQIKADTLFSSWQFFGTKQQLHILEQHILDTGYRLGFSQIIDGWYEIRTDCDKTSLERSYALIHDKSTSIIVSENIFDYLIKTLARQNKTVTFAESCTGGLIASAFTSRSGSSDILYVSVVTYANSAKHDWLDVDETIFERHGAVSEACVRAMAEGARARARSDIAIATSGIAGPAGGTPLKPVGTVYIAVSDSRQTRVKHLLLKGDRNYIQYQAMMHAVKLMIEMVNGI